jgi:hypothetical protein
MSIPKDEIDKASVVTEPVTPDLTASEDNPVVIDGTGKEADPNFISPVQTNQGEEILVAGLSSKFTNKAGKVITDAVDAWTDTMGGVDVTQSPNQKKKPDTTIQGDSPVATVDTEGTVVIRPMSMEELNSVREYMGRDDINFDVVLPNLSNIDSKLSDDTADVQFKKLIGAMFEHYKKTKGPDGDPLLQKGERGFAQIIEDANKIGSVDIMLQLLEREPGKRLFNDAELLAARRTVLSFEILAQKALKKWEKTGDQVDLANALQALNISAYAQIQLTGAQEDIGRALVSNRIIASPGKSRVNALRTWMDTNTVSDFSAVINDKNVAEFIEANGGIETVTALVWGYKNLPNDASRNKFLRNTFLETAKQTPRMVMEIYQTALLSSGVTHAYNAAGTAVMMELQMIERFFMGEFGEAGQMLKAHATYFPQALMAMSHALIFEKSKVENVSKLDVDGRSITRHAFGLRNRIVDGEGGAIESTAAMAIDGFGISMRALGYRPMIAVDEFFKTMARGMEIQALAHRAGSDAEKAVRLNLKDSGKNPTQIKLAADKAYQAAYAKTLNSQQAFEEASEFARMVTFQDDLPGALGNAGKFFNNPVIKIWVPFYKTPTQIVRRVSERTPLALMMPSVMKDKLINGNPRQRKEALVRMSTGTALFGTTMFVASGGVNEDFVITGYGPRDPDIRRRWLENNEPYSIGIRNPETGDWQFISYARYDPVAGTLAMAADATDIIYNVDDDDTLLDIMVGGGTATMKYTATALPMTQFIGEMVDVAGAKYESHESKVERITQLLAKQTFMAGGIVKEHVMSGGFGGVQLKGSIERSGYGEGTEFGDMTLGSEYGSSIIPQDQYQDIPFWDRPTGLYPITRAYYEMLNSICSKTAGCSSELPVKVNRWNEPMPQTRGTGWELIQPWRIINKPGANKINKELETLNFAFPRLSITMGEPMIKLNAEQYARYVELYNNPASSVYAEEYFKTNVYSGGDSLMPKGVTVALTDAIDSDQYQNMQIINNVTQGYATEPSSRGYRVEILKGVDSEYKNYAKDLMLYEFPELQALVQQRNSFKDEMGRNPRLLVKPSYGELEAASDQNMKELFGVGQ